MTISLQQAKSNHDSLLIKLEQLQQKHDQLPESKKADFLQQIYFPELWESFFQASVLQFELRLPLGNDTHEKAYIDAKFVELNHFFYRKCRAIRLPPIGK